MCRHYIVFILYYYSFIVTSYTTNVQRRSPVVGPCKEQSIIQPLDLSSPGCPYHRIVQLPNKICLGSCPHVYEPNLKKSANGIFNRCVMCQPDIQIITAGVPCQNATHTWKHYRQLTIVRGCKCTYIDCECPLRKRDMFEKMKKTAMKYKTVYTKKTVIN
uniref:DAN domain-containing protein n=1 Tax=Clytia hemisphaerica TaxID=252671 RepID=A0A7M5WK17_9CNID|eukprot:TCONS_00028442-protein